MSQALSPAGSGWMSIRRLVHPPALPRLCALLCAALILSAPPTQGAGTPTRAGANPKSGANPRVGKAPKTAPEGIPALPGALGPLTLRYLNGWYAFDPGVATRHGIHSGDDHLGGYTREQIMAEIARLKALDSELSGMKTFGWSAGQRVDYERLLLHIQSRRLELETIRRWERDPGYYVDILCVGLAGLMDDPGLSPAERRRAVTARLALSSEVLGAALANISNPPRPWVQLALRGTEGLMTYLSRELPALLDAAGATEQPGAEAGGTPPPEGVTSILAAAHRDLTSFAAWLKDDLLPASSSSFALGPDVTARALATAEACDATLPRLEKLAVDEVTTLKLQLESTARGLDPTRSSLESGRIYSIDHPAPNRLLAEAERIFRSIDQRLSDQALVEHRDSLTVRILPNPAFARPFGIARLRVSGPWEKRRSTPTIFLSLPEPELDDLREEDHLRAFSRYALPFLLMRHGEPGQLTAAARVPSSTESRLNSALASRSTIEGWGAYAEQLMLENGYGDRDARLQLFQLRSALLDATRFLVTLRLHTAGMTPEQAVDAFQRDGQTVRAVAEREALLACRGIEGMAPFLGRALLTKLLNDTRRARRDAFALRGFHDELLGIGPLALRLARQRLLPGDKSPPL